MEEGPETDTLRLFGDCTVPASWVIRTADPVLKETRKVEERAIPGPPSPQILTPLPVLLRHSGGSEETLNPHVAARLANTLRLETQLRCILVDPAQLKPPELIELVEFRFKWLDPIYYPLPERKPEEDIKAAMRALAESGPLRESVLRYFLPHNKHISGGALEKLCLGRVSRQMIANYARDLGHSLPWNGDTSPNSPSPTKPRHQARAFWEGYRRQKDAALPSFEEAMKVLLKHTPEDPNSGEANQVFSTILLNRLSPIHGEDDAFEVIAEFLEEAGHLLRDKPTGSSVEEASTLEESPAEETGTRPPNLEPNETSSGDSNHPDFAKPEEESPTPWEFPDSPTDMPCQEDPLLPKIRVITEFEEGELARSEECWVQLLEKAQSIYNEEGITYYNVLHEKLLYRAMEKEQLRLELIRFLDKLSQHIDLPC